MSGRLFRPGGPHQTRNLGGDKYEMKISVPADEAGMTARECPVANCVPAYFKVKGGTGIVEPDYNKCFCPYCRHEGEPDEFYSKEQIEYARSVVTREAVGGIEEMIRRELGLDHRGRRQLAKGFMNMSIEMKPGHKPPLRYPREEELRRDVACPRCSLEHAVYGLATWCPDCGKDIFLAHLSAEFDVVRKVLEDVPGRRERLGRRVAARDIENALEDVVSIFEGVLKFVVRRAVDQRSGREEAEEVVRKARNAFQNPLRAEGILKDVLGLELLTGLALQSAIAWWRRSTSATRLHTTSALLILAFSLGLSPADLRGETCRSGRVRFSRWRRSPSVFWGSSTLRRQRSHQRLEARRRHRGGPTDRETRVCPTGGRAAAPNLLPGGPQKRLSTACFSADFRLPLRLWACDRIGHAVRRGLSRGGTKLVANATGATEGRAARYLRSRSLGDRRASGAVYTPPHLVEFVLDLAGYLDEKPLEAVRVVDPACGAGVFLVAAMRRLARSVEKRGVHLQSAAGAQVLAKLVRENLIGVDIDRRACALARSSVLDAFRELTGSKARPALTPSIACGDFLRPRGSALLLVTGGPVGLVVGNPPYVTTTRLATAQKEFYRERFETAHGRIDLYQLFFEKALGVLSPGGRLAFITPNKFLTSQSGSRLRALLLRAASVHTVANFRSHRVFSDAATVPCVTVVEKQGEAAELTSLECGEKPDANGRVTVLGRASVLQRELTRGPWQLGDTDLLGLSHRLLKQHGRLEQFAVRISAGTATGRDSIFVMSGDVAANVEDELLRPVIRGRDIDAFGLRPPELMALVPYHFGENGVPALVDIARYPKARRHLSRERSTLELRHCVRVWRKQWYDLHDPVPFDIAKAPKIVVPDVADRSRFAVDEGRYLPLHSAYYIVPTDTRDLDFLAALLNSTPLTFLMRFRSPVVKDGFSRYRRQFLAELPVPLVDKTTSSAIARAGRERDHDRLDGLVFRALGVEGREAKAMQRFLRHARGPIRGEYR